jgi:L-alanine-DL-glutamate epimerase-like enolase superfamily enzyme
VKLRVATEIWPYKVPFRIARGIASELALIVVTLVDDEGNVGRGEASGVDYEGESVPVLCAQIEACRPQLEAGVTRAELAGLLPAGGARNAVDCALWDLTAKRSGQSVWRLARLSNPKPLTTCVTIGIDSNDAVAASARHYRKWPLLKIKVDDTRHIDVIRLVHAASPEAAIVVDPNQSWTCELLNRLEPELASLGVTLIEQPVPRDADQTLRGYTGRIKLAADESVSDRGSLPRVLGLYQVINIKLDKCGGLTEALAVADAAKALDLEIMVGCMEGTSLAMAPGMVVGQLAKFVDLDGPLLHGRDRALGIEYEDGRMQLPLPTLWG